jgi:hypothetical protein
MNDPRISFSRQCLSPFCIWTKFSQGGRVGPLGLETLCVATGIEIAPMRGAGLFCISFAISCIPPASSTIDSHHPTADAINIPPAICRVSFTWRFWTCLVFSVRVSAHTIGRLLSILRSRSAGRASYAASVDCTAWAPTGTMQSTIPSNTSAMA